MYEVYMVKDGDTLESIANKFKMSKDIIEKLNDGVSIKPNEVIKVPKCCSKNFDYYVVDKGDTLYEIANQNNIEPSLLAQLNGINMDDYIYPKQVLLVPRAGSVLYFTTIGDTLAEIAKGLNVSIDELTNQNNNIYLQPEQLIVYKYK